MRSYSVKENQIGSSVSEVLRYSQKSLLLYIIEFVFWKSKDIPKEIKLSIADLDDIRREIFASSQKSLKIGPTIPKIWGNR